MKLSLQSRFANFLLLGCLRRISNLASEQCSVQSESRGLVNKSEWGYIAHLNLFDEGYNAVQGKWKWNIDRMSTVQCRIDHHTEEDCYDMFIIVKQGKSKIYILNEKVEEQTVILLALLVWAWESWKPSLNIGLMGKTRQGHRGGWRSWKNVIFQIKPCNSL